MESLMSLLHVDSSPLFAASASRQLTASIVAGLTRSDPSLAVVRRDLAAEAPAHLTAEILQVIRSTERSGLTEYQRSELAFTDRLVEEFLAARIVVVGAPMYNFSVPTQLKAWIDRICQAGRTFSYSAQGPKGLAGGKRVIIASSRGGIYSVSEGGRAMDFQEDYLSRVFGFLGITDIEIVRAEGLNIDAASRERALAAAEIVIENLPPQAA
jgi:FMN-dependent NADH-azoreductase